MVRGMAALLSLVVPESRDVVVCDGSHNGNTGE